MKKIFIVLLVLVAAGAGWFYLSRLDYSKVVFVLPSSERPSSPYYFGKDGDFFLADDLKAGLEKLGYKVEYRFRENYEDLKLGNAGNNICGQCSMKNCTTPGASSDYQTAAACPKYSNLTASVNPQTDYHGNDRCYTCSYTCNGSTAYGSETACTTANAGYTCTSQTQNGIECWVRGGAAGCPSGYDTAYPNLASCGTSGDKGWTYSSSGTSGGQTCGKCTAKNILDIHNSNI